MPIWGMVLSALAEIRTGKIRVALSVFCVAVGVATVTLITVVSGLAQQASQQIFERQVGRPATLLLSAQSEDGPPRFADNVIERMRADLRRYKITSSPLRNAQGVIYRRGEHKIGLGGEEAGAMTIGADVSLSQIRRLSMASGRWLIDEDARRLEPTLVVNETAAKKLGLTKANAAGAQVELAAPQLWVRARIVGVLQGGEEMGEIYMPYQAMNRWNIGEESTEFAVRVPKADAKRVTQQLKTDSVRSWGLPRPVDVRREDGDFSFINRTLGKVMLAAAVALLFLGSLPVLALGLLAVRQRRSELGVQRCFGATGADLFLTVLLESLIVSCTGGLLGIALVYAVHDPLISFLVSKGPFSGSDIVASFPWEAAMLGLGVAICVGLFTGLLPALRAMQRSVIQAIRS